MKEQYIPVGIHNQEIFIINLEDGKPHCGIDGKPCFDVIRPVDVETLEYLRDMDQREDEYKELWKEAVAADATEQGFTDWLEDLWAEEFDEEDEEDFPGKDNSFCRYLDEDLREAADKFLLEECGVEVGTWEAAGTYSPGSFGSEKFTGWDYVFDTPLAKKYAKEYEKRFFKLR